MTQELAKKIAVSGSQLLELNSKNPGYYPTKIDPMVCRLKNANITYPQQAKGEWLARTNEAIKRVLEELENGPEDPGATTTTGLLLSDLKLLQSQIKRALHVEKPVIAAAAKRLGCINEIKDELTRLGDDAYTKWESTKDQCSPLPLRHLLAPSPKKAEFREDVLKIVREGIKNQDNMENLSGEEKHDLIIFASEHPFARLCVHLDLGVGGLHVARTPGILKEKALEERDGKQSAFHPAHQGCM